MAKLYTLGHSTHSLQDVIEILKAFDIKHLVDVRTIPRSRHVPWFNKNEFKISLENETIGYTHLEKLGGLRKCSTNSINTGWRNLSFRGFADYMQTRPFFLGLKELHAILSQYKKVAIMCAEALPWRCHRSLIADAEFIRNIHVLDIFNKDTVKVHELTSFARVNKNLRPYRLYYPG